MKKLREKTNSNKKDCALPAPTSFFVSLSLWGEKDKWNETKQLQKVNGDAIAFFQHLVQNFTEFIDM